MGKSICFCCKKKFNKIYLNTCEYCQELYCISHCAPDIHKCINQENFINNKKDEFLTNQKNMILDTRKIEKI